MYNVVKSFYNKVSPYRFKHLGQLNMLPGGSIESFASTMTFRFMTLLNSNTKVLEFNNVNKLPADHDCDWRELNNERDCIARNFCKNKTEFSHDELKYV